MSNNEYQHGQSIKTDDSLVDGRAALVAKVLNEINNAYANTVKMHRRASEIVCIGVVVE